MTKSLSKATIAKRQASPPPATSAIEIAHILEEIIAAGHEDLMLPADARVVVEAALLEYLRLFPRSTHVTTSRRGSSWYDVPERHSAKMRWPSGKPPTRIPPILEWHLHCKICHENLATVGADRGERQYPRPLLDMLDRHGVRCAIALLLWSERMGKRVSPDLIVAKLGDGYDDKCPAKPQPRKLAAR